ncbi:MAG: DUF3667 domain-containing protein [Clostridia bacterium]|nr:DUF3667 domain-containing protein [Clostridia bacterium]
MTISFYDVTIKPENIVKRYLSGRRKQYAAEGL